MKTVGMETAYEAAQKIAERTAEVRAQEAGHYDGHRAEGADLALVYAVLAVADALRAMKGKVIA